MNCQLSTHDNQKIKYLCIDVKCTIPSKLGCADCFLEDHVMHKRIPIPTFQKELSEKVGSIKLDVEDEIHVDLESEFQLVQDQLVNKLQSLKEDMKQGIQQEVQLYKQTVKNFKNDVKDSLKPMVQLAQEPITQLSKQQLDTAVAFYLDQGLQESLSKQVNELQARKAKAVNKREKAMGKLTQFVESLIRELDECQAEKVLKKKVQFVEQEGTPEKGTSSTSACSTVRSEKSIIEQARSRRFPATSKPIMKKFPESNI